jgi:hypothetical protein
MNRKSTIRNTGLGTAATRVTGHKYVAYVKVGYAKLLRIREDMANYDGLAAFTPRKSEIVSTLIRGGVEPLQAREIAKMCDEEPAWL